MIIGVSSQVEIYHIASVMGFAPPVRRAFGTVDVMEYDQQYMFFVASAANVASQIQECLIYEPGIGRVLLIGAVAEDAITITNVDELEEWMVLSLTPAQKSKIANRVFGVLSQGTLIRMGFELYQEITGTTQTLEEFVRDAAPLPPTLPRIKVARVKRIREETCIVCTGEPATVLLDCGHECLCNACATRWVDQTGQCPTCKQSISKMFVDQ